MDKSILERQTGIKITSGDDIRLLIIANDGTQRDPVHVPYLGNAREVAWLLREYNELKSLLDANGDLISPPRVFTFGPTGTPVECWCVVGTEPSEPSILHVKITCDGAPVATGTARYNPPTSANAS